MSTSSIKGLFITGTGTDVGKTIVVSSLLRALREKKCPALAIKPIQTGIDLDNVADDGDMSLYTSALHDVADFPKISSYIVPQTLHTFRLAASPHLASAQENEVLTVASLQKELYALYDAKEKQCGQEAPLLTEGAGGVLVPISEEESTLDLMQALNFPVLIVMNNVLGALNHALLTVEILRQRGLEILGIVATETKVRSPENTALLEDNIHYLRNIMKIAVWELPFIPELQQIHEKKVHDASSAWHMASRYLDAVAQCCVDRWNISTHAVENTNSVCHKELEVHNQHLLDWDAQHLWHPYTSSVNPLPVYEVTRTAGTRIFIKDKAAGFAERPLIDGMASWWCAIHGYGHETLVHAAKKQAENMAHVMFGGLTHKPAVDCAKTLLPLLPSGLTRLFWSDSGSVAVEVALKMALQYQKGMGKNKRHKILTPLGGYHGDTMGAMSVCDPVNGMHGLFRGALAEQIFIPRPACRFDRPFDDSCLVELEQAFTQHGEELAAVIIEPIVQGAGGMYFYHPAYLQRLRELCNEHQVLLIFDEIATGFGRTGKMFAAEWAHVSPDIMCVGKGLTGGFMSLAATICSDHVADSICADGNVFMHGPTFMANPLACTITKASLELLLATPWQDNVQNIEQELRHGLQACATMQGVADVRVLGAIGVVEMDRSINMRTLQAFFVQKGVWIRPFGRLIYIMPPYISTNEDIAMLCTTIKDAIAQEAYI